MTAIDLSPARTGIACASNTAHEDPTCGRHQGKDIELRAVEALPEEIGVEDQRPDDHCAADGDGEEDAEAVEGDRVHDRGQAMPDQVVVVPLPKSRAAGG